MTRSICGGRASACRDRAVNLRRIFPPRSFSLDKGRFLDTLLHLANLVLHIDKFLGEFIHVYGAPGLCGRFS